VTKNKTINETLQQFSQKFINEFYKEAQKQESAYKKYIAKTNLESATFITLPKCPHVLFHRAK
jgi:hypothetical protein